MKILITTALYPPELGVSAIYIKELAKRLKDKNEVKILLYGHLPEKISGVSFVCVNKNQLLLLRLFKFFLVLWRESKNVDLIYSENGASVELPLALLSFFKKMFIVFHIGDLLAQEKTKNNNILAYIHKALLKKALFIVKKIPNNRPEILPFEKYPEKEMKEYEESWEKHIKKLENIFYNARKN